MDEIAKLQKELVAFPELQEFQQEFAQLQKIWAEPLTVMVAGEFSTGKSTFINALLGKKVVEVDATESTAVITKLTYGAPEQIIVHFKDGHSQACKAQSFKEITALQGGKTTSTQQEVSYVERKIPLDFLRHITLIDSPGLNSNYTNHLEMTQRYLQKVDLVLWLISASQAAKAEETAMITKLAKNRKPLIIVNKVDSFLEDLEADEDDEIDEAEAIQENEKEIMAKLNHQGEAIFSISARQAWQAQENGKSMDDPGHLAPVRQRLREEITHQEKYKQEAFAEKFASFWYALVRYLEKDFSGDDNYAGYLKKKQKYLPLEDSIQQIAAWLQTALRASPSALRTYWQAVQQLLDGPEQTTKDQAFTTLCKLAPDYPPARDILLDECLRRNDLKELARQLQRYVADGDTQSRKALALLYYYGLGLEKDSKEAQKLLENSVLTSEDSLCLLVLASLYKEDLPKVREVLAPLLKSENAAAYCLLGNCYDAAYQIKQAQKKPSLLTRVLKLTNRKRNPAIKIYQKAAALGSSEALYHLGKLYMHEDKAKALSLIQKAASYGYVPALATYGKLLYDDSGSALDKKQGWQYLLQAASLGSAQAAVDCGREYWQKNKGQDQQGKAYALNQPFAVAGPAKAQIICGLCSLYGQGTAKNEAKAFAYFQAAAKRGDGEAYYCLAKCHKEKIGTHANYGKALSLYQQAAQLGYIPAMSTLATWYNEGRLVEKDEKIAWQWVTDAAVLGEPHASYLLGLRYKDGKSSLAKKLFQQASNTADAELKNAAQKEEKALHSLPDWLMVGLSSICLLGSFIYYLTV